LTLKEKINLSTAVVISFLFSACISKNLTNNANHLIIQDQGSFTVGGSIIRNAGTFDPINHGGFNPANQASEGQTLHGDHAYVFYQIPAKPRKLPLVFWHGYGQSAKTWETTADGREGFQNIFLRRHFPVYLIDQPRRGRSGRSTVSSTINASPDDQLWFGIFRMGIGTDFYPGVQFSKNPDALNQFYRHMVPNTGPYDIEVNTNAVSALFNKIGDAILVTHSHSGGQGWVTAIKNSHIKSIVSYEPGSGFVFPKGEVPDSINYVGGILRGVGVPMDDFMKLTKIPIIIYYGDYIPDNPSKYPGEEQWRAALTMAKRWRDTVNKYGGDVTIVRLPDAGLKGNTHFPMSDLNNIEVAELLSKFLKSKSLD
jgi:pimeloyl-ACP methyl ester carboxylesterase